MKKTLSLLLVCLLFLSYNLTGAAAVDGESTVGGVQGVADEILAFETRGQDVQTWLSTGEVGSGYLFALAHGEYDLSACVDAVATRLAKGDGSAASRRKDALLLLACGFDNPICDAVLDENADAQGIMGEIFSLHLLNNGRRAASFTQAELTARLLDRRLSDGGWALAGEHADVDVTAMVLQALAPQYAKNDAVTAACDAAVSLLGTRQKPNGGFSGFGGENPESTAQVVIALSSLGVDCLTDARFVKDGKTVMDGLALYRLADGTFCHEAGGAYNATATEQVFAACESVLLAAQGKRLYVFDTSDLRVLPMDLAPAATETATEKTTETAPETAPNGARRALSLKAVLLIAAGVLTAAAVVFLLVTKRRGWKHFLALGLVAAAVFGFLAFSHIDTPADYFGVSPAAKENAVGTVTISVRCDTVAGQSPAAPANGVILAPTQFAVAQGETVFDLLTEASRQGGFAVASRGVGGGTTYVTGINGLDEFAFGELSGWMYTVNGVSVDVACDRCTLHDGDVVVWAYTQSIGADLTEVSA